jgi:alpha-2-macroglobulin
LKEGLKGFVAGRILRYSALPTADLSLRKLAAIEALSRYNEATADMLGAITLATPTYGEIHLRPCR